METKSTALVGGRLIDGTGGEPVENSAVIIEGGVVSAAGAAKNVKLPEGCEVIDVTGKTVMPGLIDLHVHLALERPSLMSAVRPAYIFKPQPWFGLLCYANAQKCYEMGFTTLRDVGEMIGEYSPLSLRDAINSGIVKGPRLFVSGPWLTTSCGHNGGTLPDWIERRDVISDWIVDGPDECLKAVRERIKMGVDFIKIFGSGGISNGWNKQELNDAELAAIVGEAHTKGKMVSAHLEYPEGIKACVRAGIDTVEHGWVLDEECVGLMLEKNVTMVPTIGVVWNIVNRSKELGLPDFYVEQCKRNMYGKAMASFKMAYEAGVKLAFGTDTGFFTNPHGTNAHELELLMKCCDMTAMEAIMCATKHAAETMRMDKKLGTLEPQKYADIIVVDGDPLADIAVLQKKENILMVMKQGSIDIDRTH